MCVFRRVRIVLARFCATEAENKSAPVRAAAVKTLAKLSLEARTAYDGALALMAEDADPRVRAAVRLLAHHATGLAAPPPRPARPAAAEESE